MWKGLKIVLVCSFDAKLTNSLYWGTAVSIGPGDNQRRPTGVPLWWVWSLGGFSKILKIPWDERKDSFGLLLSCLIQKRILFACTVPYLNSLLILVCSFTLVITFNRAKLNIKNMVGCKERWFRFSYIWISIWKKLSLLSTPFLV